jgi:O-acetyl-ADP-ribose deacetylase (regulator of RNase III)
LVVLLLMAAQAISHRLSPTARLVLQRGDITRFQGDAIVNAANERCLGGGGVDGAIHRAAGPALRDACLALPEVRPGVRCPTGEARVTRGGALPARHVIHTVGPVYDDAESSAPLLTAAYRSSLLAARDAGLRSVAFPAISCGVFGYPLGEAAEVRPTPGGQREGQQRGAGARCRGWATVLLLGADERRRCCTRRVQIAVRTIREHVGGSLQEVHFFLFGQRELDAWREEALRQLGEEVGPEAGAAGEAPPQQEEQPAPEEQLPAQGGEPRPEL